MVKIFNDSISSIERSHWAIYLEKWQSGRMRWTRNPVYGFCRIEGSNPSFSARIAIYLYDFKGIFHLGQI